MSSDKPIWQRLESDTDKSFEAFALYRDMDANRSIRAVAEKLGKSDTIIGRWSTANDWVNRVAAFDAFQDEKNLNKNAERQEKIKDNAFKDYEFLRRSIDNFKTNIEAMRFIGVNAYEIGTLVELMKKADDYARRAVGLPDKITEQKNEHTGKDGGAIETRNTNVVVNAENIHDAGNILKQLADLGAIPSTGSQADNDPAPE